MNKVTLDRAGIYFDFWNNQNESWISKNIADGSLPITWYLEYPIQIREPLTVKDLLHILKPYHDVIDLVLARQLAGISFDEILKLIDSDAPAKKEIKPTSVYLIKLADSIPMNQDEEDFNFLNTYSVLMGLEVIDEIGDNDELHSLSTLDLFDWCDLPLGIDDYIEYVNPTTDEVLFEGVMNWTLYDVISTVLSQIATTLQITAATSMISAKSQVESGPLRIQDVLDWIDDLDKVFLK